MDSHRLGRMVVMRFKSLISIVAISALSASLAACGTSTRSTSEPTPSASDLPSLIPSVAPSPVPSVSPSAAETSDGSLNAGAVTAGPVSVSGALDAEPVVKIKDNGAPVSTLIVKDVSLGKGHSVIPGSTVTAHYVGYGASTGVMFDSSWARQEPATFPLDGVIEGWQVGLVGMKEGGRRILVIPAAQGYGDAPPDGSGIEPGETLIFVVDMVAVS